MPVDNNQFSDTLNIKGRNNISQYCFLCFITRMDTEGKFLVNPVLDFVRRRNRVRIQKGSSRCPGFCEPMPMGGITMQFTPYFCLAINAASTATSWERIQSVIYGKCRL